MSATKGILIWALMRGIACAASHVGDGGADDVTARLFQTTYLRNSGVHIPCVSLGHRLHGDGRTAPDLYPSYH